MRILGIDYGLKRVGLALSDPTGLFAQGFTVLQRTSDEQIVSEITRIVSEHEVNQIVVGLPRHMNGSIGERAEQCMAFAEELRELCSIPVDLLDERLTSVAAERILIEADVRRNKRKQVVDAVAATLLLQTYLDRRNSANQRRSSENWSDED